MLISLRSFVRLSDLSLSRALNLHLSRLESSLSHTVGAYKYLISHNYAGRRFEIKLKYCSMKCLTPEEGRLVSFFTSIKYLILLESIDFLLIDNTILLSIKDQMKG